jgi:GntR family transcriptional regulator, transcriptional repressor for pyruvate dehydrogenase complex
MADRAARELEQYIYEELEVGASLPSESELARSMGMSRLTMREATRKLQARGVLKISMGRRPVVAAPTGSLVGDFFRSALRRDPRAVLDLLEIRQALEVHIAAAAATRASRTAVAAIEATIEEQRRAGDDVAAFHEADIRFHESLAAATGNRMMTVLLEELSEPLRASRMRSFTGRVERGGTAQDVIARHVAILDRIRAGDAAGAGAAMRDHLSQTERDLLASLQAPAAPADTNKPVR